MSENTEVNNENIETGNESSEKKGKFIGVTDNHRIKIGSIQYIVQKLHTVDPTKFPTFNASKQSATKRQEWRDDGEYGLHMSGLVSAIKYIIVQEVGLGIDDSAPLKEYLRILRKTSEEITDFVNDQLKVDIKK